MGKTLRTLISLLLSMAFLCAESTLAADINGKTDYYPLDMVVVIDTSGSMNFSDSTHMTSEAINMLLNMMPAEDSRIGVITFNTSPSALTVDANNDPDLAEIKDLDKIQNIRKSAAEIAYKGDTGIGNAVQMATDLLKNKSQDSNRKKAILLFTDGVDDFGTDQYSLAKCRENECNATLWAQNNTCPIYCIGYNYTTSSGASSMGADGEGLTKLNNISSTSGGQAKAITKINEIEDMFVGILAQICNLYYIHIDDIPGDGQRHEKMIPISPEVIEANIRISTSTQSAISNGTIELYNPNGEKVVLQNGNNIRYDVDAIAASIKIMAPKPGEWKLVLNGIIGEDIKIGLLEHYKLGIASRLTTPEKNPEGIAYVGDVIGVETYLTNDGNKISDNAIYNSVTTARITVTPRATPENPIAYALTFDGDKYIGNFEITEDSVYDVAVEISSESFIRTDYLTIQSSNHPLVLEKNIGNIELNKRKQKSIDDIYSYVSDPENDKITAKVTGISNPDMADARIDGNKAVIKGKGWGATNVTVTYTDAQGNSVNTTFKVSVKNPMFFVILGIILLLIILLIILLATFLHKKTLKISGKIRVTYISEAVDNDGRSPETVTEIFKDVNREDDYSDIVNSGGTGNEFPSEEEFASFEKAAADPTKLEEHLNDTFDGWMEISTELDKQKKMYSVIESFSDIYTKHMTTNESHTSEKATAVSAFINKFQAFNDVKVVGTPFGRKGIVLVFGKHCNIKCHSHRVEKFRLRTGDVGRKAIQLDFSVPLESEQSDKKMCAYIEFEYTN